MSEQMSETAETPYGMAAVPGVIPPVWLTVCNRCGSVVMRRDLHDAFHPSTSPGQAGPR